MKRRYLPYIVLLLIGCNSAIEQGSNEVTVAEFYQTEFFRDVQMASVFEDSKTFVDSKPKRALSVIIEDYKSLKTQEGFSLESFVADNFDKPFETTSGFKSDTSRSMKEHIKSLWPVLTREADNAVDGSSLIGLPKSYIVPGGRFREVYYWDSYFTIEGLLDSGEEEMAVNMLDNFSSLIDSIGFIPNGNRAYYLGRSQPPFYSLTLAAIASENRDQYITYLPHLVNEYSFWMKGAKNLTNEGATRRVVKLQDGSILNRYWDDLKGPRPESFKEDFELVEENSLDETIAYKHLRAGAESGWDYSSRWFGDGKNLSTIRTTDILPVDLNSLLYHLEIKIAQGFNWKGELDSAKHYLELAGKRKSAINKHLWDDEEEFYVDYNFIEKKPTGVHSLAAAYPLYFYLADKARASKVSEKLLEQFLLKGGFVTTLNETGEQWDYPNGWAPLQWITVNGLFNYGYYDDGLDAITRWLNRNNDVYKATGKMMEKYDVVNTELLGGGGEYPLQDGFGWTNGVALAFQSILEDKNEVIKQRSENNSEEEQVLNITY